MINAPVPERLRLVPPLILTEAQAEEFLAALPAFLDSATRVPRPHDVQHFLRDDDLSPASRSRCSTWPTGSRPTGSAEKPAGRPQSVALLFDKHVHPHAVVVRGRHGPARRPSADRRRPVTSQLGREETDRGHRAGPVAGYVDAVVDPDLRPARIKALATVSAVPVINALTDEFHPCQVLSPTCRRSGSDTAALAGLTHDLPRRRREQHGSLAAARRRQCRYARAGLAPIGFHPDPDVLRDAKNRGAGHRRVDRAHQRPARGRRRRRRRRHRHLDLDGPGERRPRPHRSRSARSRSTPTCSAAADAAAHRAALPACAPRLGDHRRGHRRAAVARSGTRPRTGCTPRRRLLAWLIERAGAMTPSVGTPVGCRPADDPAPGRPASTDHRLLRSTRSGRRPSC